MRGGISDNRVLETVRLFSFGLLSAENNITKSSVVLPCNRRIVVSLGILQICGSGGIDIIH